MQIKFSLKIKYQNSFTSKRTLQNNHRRAYDFMTTNQLIDMSTSTSRAIGPGCACVSPENLFVSNLNIYKAIVDRKRI